MGLMLDSGVFISAERKRISPQQVVEGLLRRFGLIPFGISVVTVAELAHGSHRGDRKQQEQQGRFLKETLGLVTVHDFTEPRALLLGELGASLAAKGQTIAFQDPIIGTTALTLDYAVLTNNPRHFSTIPSLTVHTL